MAVHWLFAIVAGTFYLAVIAAVVLVVAAAIRVLGRPARMSATSGYPAPANSPRESPLDILARRFASGEISAEEFQKARDLLQGGPNPPTS